MYLSDREVGRILNHLKSGKSIEETKKISEYNKGEIKYAINQLLKENSKYYDLNLHTVIIQREKEYEQEQEKLKTKALSLLEIDGSKENAAKQTGLSLQKINETLKKLEEKNENYFQIIQFKIKEYEQIKEEKESKLDEAIISWLMEKTIYREAARKFGVSLDRVKKAIERLNNPNIPDKYSLYLKITQNNKDTLPSVQTKGIANAKNAQELKLEYIIDEILKNEISVEDASIKYGKRSSEILHYMRKISNKEKKVKLATILAKYPNFYTSETPKGKSLQKYKYNAQKEIIL